MTGAGRALDAAQSVNLCKGCSLMEARDGRGRVEMAFVGGDRPQKLPSQVPAALARRLKGLKERGPTLRWAIVATMGIVLGICSIALAYLPARWRALSVAAVLCPFLAMILGDARRLFLAIVILDIPFQVDIHLGFRPEIAELGGISGLGISLTTISLVVLYALWLIDVLTKSTQPPFRPSLRTTLPLGLYVGFAALSVAVAPDATLSIFEVFLLLQTFLLYLYIVATVRTREDLLFIVLMLLLGLVAESLIMIWVYLTGQDISLAGISTRVEPQFATGLHARPGGTIQSPNVAAGYLCFLLAPALSLLLVRLGRFYKLLALLGFGLGWVALIATLSRGGWVAFAVSITILCLGAWRRGRLSPGVPVSISLAIVLAFLLFRETIQTRLFAYDLGAAYGRIPLMKLAFQMIREHPLLGVGANSFGAVINLYLPPELSQEWLYAVHNKYLLVWAETGIGGLLAFVAFLVGTVRCGLLCWRANDPFLSPLALGLTAGIVGEIAHMFVEIFNGRAPVQLLWVIAALVTVMVDMGRGRFEAKTIEVE